MLLTAVRTASARRHLPEHVETGFVDDNAGRKLAAADWAFDQYGSHDPGLPHGAAQPGKGLRVSVLEVHVTNSHAMDPAPTSSPRHDRNNTTSPASSTVN